MADARETFYPVEIQRDYQGMMRVLWDDGHARARRGRALTRRTLTLQYGMYLIGTVYNFCTPHARLGLPGPTAGASGIKRTPAMAAGITDHCWTVRELRSSPVPPPRWTPPKQRGCPSRALQCRVARWCS